MARQVETMDDPAPLTGHHVPASLDPTKATAADEHPRATMSGPQGFARSGSRVFDLIGGTARVGVSVSALAAGELTRRSVDLARVVLPADIAKGPLDAIERRVGRRQSDARKSEQQSLDEVSKAAESVLNRVVVEIVDMLDMEQLIDHVPINRVVARIDLPEVIDEIDLTGIVREGTKGLGGEALDSARTGLMAMDQWSARLIDRILRRKGPRDLFITSEADGRHGTTGEVAP